MKSIITKGIICIKDDLNIEYNVCYLEHIQNEDNTFKYVFKPNYSVISLLDSNIFQGIPGINIDLKKEEYVRENIMPVFISERVPSEKREDYYELLQEVNMDYMNPIEYLIRTKKRYSGDKLYVIPYENKENIILEKIEGKNNISGIIKIILDNIASGNKIILNGSLIEGNEAFKILIHLYKKSLSSAKENQKAGIEEAKKNGKYNGRKPIIVEEIKFKSMLEKVNNKEISSKEAAKNLGISIDKYYRLKKKMDNNK